MAIVDLTPLVLTQAELAAVYQALGLLSPAAGTALADLGVSPRALAAAQARLLERGVLQSPAALAADLQPMFETVGRPRLLGVLQHRQPGRPEQRTSFSWTPAALVLNTLDAQGNHVLEPLPDLAAVAERALSANGVDAAHPPAASPAPVAPETLAQTATHRALFMLVADVGGPRQREEALAWLVAAGQLWAIAPRSGGQATLAAIGRPALLALLTDRVARAAQAALATR